MSAVTSSFNLDEFGSLSREHLVYLARTAESSERFEGLPPLFTEIDTSDFSVSDMCKFMRYPGFVFSEFCQFYFRLVFVLSKQQAGAYGCSGSG